MALSKKDKKYIKLNYKTQDIQQLSKKLQKPQKEINAYLNKKGKATKIKNPKSPKQDIYNFKKIVEFVKNSKVEIIILLTIGTLIYLNALNGEFVSDDIEGILNNPLYNSLSQALASFKINQIIFGVLISFFGKTSPIPFHVASLLLHLLNGFLAYILVSILFNKKVGFYSSILFIIHPVAVESVAWISGSLYLSINLFLLLTSIFYVLYKKSSENIYLFISIAIYFMSIIFVRRPWLINIIFTLIIIEVFFLNSKVNLKLLKNFAAYIFLSLFLAIYFIFKLPNRTSSIIGFQQLESVSYLTRFVYSFSESIKLYFIPLKLTLYHDQSVITHSQLTIDILIFIVAIFTIVYFYKKNKKISGLLLIMITSFSFSLLPIQVAWFVAERYLYSGLFAFCILVVLFLEYLENKTKIISLAMICYLLIATLFAIKTFTRNIDWQSRKNLWESAAKINPNSARTYNNLGDVYTNEGNITFAIQSFEKAINLNPFYAEAHHNLANAYLKNQQIQLAEQHYFKALEINPNLYQSYYQLGIIHAQQKDVNKAKEYLQKSLEINNTYLPAKNLLENIQTNESK